MDNQSWRDRRLPRLCLCVVFAGGMLTTAPRIVLADGPALDIVLALDTSGSMNLEVADVSNNLNSFIALLEAHGWDPHLVLLAETGVCVPAPLGSGVCPADENLPVYRHVNVEIGSNDALQAILDHHGDYSASLRPGSRRATIVVSDDDSDLGAAQFVSALLALDPEFERFSAHAIAASLPPNFFAFDVCHPSDGVFLSAAEGTVYKALAAQRAGVFHDLCLQNVQPGFEAMAATYGEVIFLDGFESGTTDAWSGQ